MRGEHLITKSWQYALVYDKGSALVSRQLVVRSLPNELSLSRYGFSVSRRVGNAVVRNRVRRRLREIMRAASLKPGWDIVLLARPAAATIDYATLRKSVVRLLSQAQLLANENEEVCLSLN